MRLFSPDYAWEWNGTEWVPAQQPVFSPDGQHLWVGEQWIPVPPYQGPISIHREQEVLNGSIDMASVEGTGHEVVHEEQSHGDNEPEHVETQDDESQFRVHTEEDDETFTDEDSVSFVGQPSIQGDESFDATNHESEVQEIHDIDLSGWEIAVIGQDVNGNRIELFDEIRDSTVTDLLRITAEYIEEIPRFFGDEERQIFMVTLYLLPPRNVFFPWVIEQHGSDVIESLYRCSIDEFWQKKVIDRTATGSLYLPNLHFIWYSDALEISAEGHFGFDSIRQQDLDINLNIPSITTSDIMQLIVWLVNGKYEKIKQHRW